MLKWLRRAMASLLVLAVLLLLAVQGLRWWAYGDEQRDAVALASVMPPPAAGSNGFAALSLSDFDVPAELLDTELAAEVRDFSRWLDSWTSVAGQPTVETWSSGLAGRYPARTALTHSSPLCPLNGADCLAFAKNDAGDARKLLASESARIAQVDQVLSADHLRSPYPASHFAPLPPYNTLRLSLTQAAFDAVDGRVPEAMARTCRTLAGARRFNADEPNLVGKMVFPALAQGSASLLLDLRRDYPDVPLPPECDAALAPVQADEFLICEAMRGEFRMGAAFAAMQDRQYAGRWTPRALLARWVLMDSRLQDAWMAQTFAAPCTDDYQRDVLEGSVPPPPQRAVSSDDLHCYGASVSCLLAEIALPALGDYQGRLLDNAARLRVLLAAHAALGAELDAQALQELAQSPGYTVSLNAEGRTLSLLNRFERGRDAPDFKVSF